MRQKRTLLVVEDNVINRKMLCKMLSDGYNIIEADNGEVALKILREEKENISLVLLDLVMPIMDGYVFLKKCKSEDEIKNIPIIITTQKDSDDNEIMALTLGAADYVTKPYKTQIIKRRIANIINLREKSAMLNLLEKDTLTGVLSKDFFFHEAEKIIKENKDKEYDIICCDIENFKIVNDILGRQACDTILRKIGDIFLAKPSNYSLCARIGADTFAILITREKTYSKKKFEKMQLALKKYGVSDRIVFKYGIYQIIDKTIAVSSMCDRALFALETVKHKYDVSYALYDDNLRKEMLEQQFVIDNMENGLKNREFLVYFQPKYDVNNNEIIGAEALVRWNQPQRGMMYPGSFISIFENNGFIEMLDYYVWEETCKYIKQWRDEGLKVVPISVNVSRIELFNTKLPQILLDLVGKYDIKPEFFHLEITESAYTKDIAQLIEVALELRELGFVIEMDDFGTGYSSLNMLSELPVDILKLDMRFVQGLATQSSSDIVGFVILLARSKKIKVVAEGVENKIEIDKLASLGCDYAQGYYFQKPMSAEDFENLLKENNN